MEATLKSKIAEIFVRYRFTPEDAQFISAVLSEIDEHQEHKFMTSKELFLTQPDKVDMIDRINHVEQKLVRTIYIVGLVQFVAIIASILAIVNFMLK